MGDFLKYLNVNESINDKHIFKCVLMAGTPGGGKSFVAEALTGLAGTSNIVASDSALEHFFEKLGLPKKFDKEGTEMYNIQFGVRTRAKKVTTDRFYHILNGMAPIVVDGTGQDFNRTSKIYNDLTNLGYDVSMVFVNTSLEVGLERNRKRERSLADNVLEGIWRTVQKNKPKYIALLGKDFHEIDNNYTFQKNPDEPLRDKKTFSKFDNVDPKMMSAPHKTEDDIGKHKFFAKISNIGTKIMTSPIKNPIGKKIVEQLIKIKGKYLSDLEVAPKKGMEI